MVNPTGYTALDLIGFTDKGTYLSSENYVKNDLVHYGGNIWRCLIDDTSRVEPAEGVNWTLFIEEPTNLVERIIAPVETNPATNAYAVGKQLIFNGLLCKATSAIAVGDTLAVGTNLALSDNVVEQIYSLNQGLTNSLANLSHENLLDNPWFTVNQRGNNTYSESGYSVDRWKRNAYNENGHKFTVGTIEIPYLKGDFYQVIETATNHWRHVPYTISAIIDGNLYSKTFTPYDDGQQHMGSTAWGSTSIGLDGLIWNIIENWSSSTHLVGINNNGALQSHTITAIKLELGTVSTLAMDTAPNYQQELAKCQRYFYRANMNVYCSYGIAVARSTTAARMLYQTPVPMRVKPAITFGDISVFKLINGSTHLPITNGILYGADNTDKFYLELNATTVSGTIYTLDMTATSYIDFSADL
jgi:hypothetical protein